jgi:signal transduction histidine kinase
MPRMSQPLPPLRSVCVWLALWLALAALACAILLGYRYADARGQFDADAGTLVRQIAQRVDQHDAHLTSLAAVARFDGADFANFLGVSASVRQYYPRIAEIVLVELAPEPSGSVVPRVLAVSAPAALPDAGWSPAMTQASAGIATGRARLAAGRVPGSFRLIKHIPRDPYTVLVFNIDAGQLVAADAVPRPLAWTLAIPDGATTVTTLQGATESEPLRPSRWRLPAMVMTSQLDSPSQPLVLTLRRDARWSELLPVFAVLACALLAAALLAVLRTGQRLRRARRDARLQDQALRLAHAMRVDGLGEMASGIAHELTQPMTALLSQNQAALRLIDGGATANELAPVIRTNIRLVNRAGAILERMRAFVSRRELPLADTDVNAVLQSVVDLCQADLAARGIALQWTSMEVGRAVADAVSLEQVLHNLVRNAAEAMMASDQGRQGATASTAAAAGPGGHGSSATGHGASADPAHWVRLVVRHNDIDNHTDAAITIVVEDNGPGMATDRVEQIFTPFYTTKEGGMGLGLPLCERLMEAMGGRIQVDSVLGQGTRFTLTLKAAA